MAPEIAEIPPRIVPAPELPGVQPKAIEFDFQKLPNLESLSTSPKFGTRKQLTVPVCQVEAARHAAMARLLEGEWGETGAHYSPTIVDLVKELRIHAAAESRNRSVESALDRFYQLADALARGEILSRSLDDLDRLRETVRKAKQEGLRLPIEPEELDKRRTLLLEAANRAEAAVGVMNIELKHRIGYSGQSQDLLAPSDDFAVSAQSVDTEKAVQTALEKRGDLLFLRTAYLRLNPDTLPCIREVIRTEIEAAKAGVKPPRMACRADERTLRTTLGGKTASLPDPHFAAETALCRARLYEIIAEHERTVADEVRAAAIMVSAQSRQVALVKSRTERALTRRKEAGDVGPIALHALDLEASTCRAELAAAVMAYHQARVKWEAAQGLYSSP